MVITQIFEYIPWDLFRMLLSGWGGRAVGSLPVHDDKEGGHHVSEILSYI